MKHIKTFIIACISCFIIADANATFNHSIKNPGDSVKKDSVK